MKTSKSIIKRMRFLLVATIALIGLFTFCPDTLLADAAITIAFVAPVVVAQTGKTSKELREERKVIKDQIDAITKKVDDEKRSFNSDEAKELRDLLDKEAEFNRNIELALELEKRAASVAGTIPGNRAEEREMGKFSFGKMAKELQARGLSGLTGLEKELADESMKEAREMGATEGKLYLGKDILDAVHNRSRIIQRTQTAQTGNANLGGNLIPTEKVGFFDALWAATVLQQLGVQNLTGLSANTDLNGWDTSPVAYWAAENGTQSPTDATTANRTLRPKLLGSAVDISMLLKIQTNSSVDAYFMDGMMKAMRVALEAAVINGDGSNKPTGILGTSGIQNVAIGTDGGAPTLAKILELVQKVQSANADTTSAKFLINPKTVAKLKQTSIDSGSGAMILAYNQYFGGIQNVIDGFPTLVTSNVPSNLTKGSTSGTCSAIIFGDFSQVVTAQFGGVEVSIDEISAAMRRTGKYAMTINMYVDSAVKQPAALGAILDATTV